MPSCWDCKTHLTSGWPANAEKNPGPSVFPDFSKPATREWWGGLYRFFTDIGIAGIWNDMNEPAVFLPPAATMPLDVRHDDRRSADRSGRIVHRHVACNQVAVELEVHREGVAGNGEAVVRSQVHVAVRLEQEAIVIKVQPFRGQVENRVGRRRRALRRR